VIYRIGIQVQVQEEPEPVGPGGRVGQVVPLSDVVVV
jgi:hypothetical protein